VPVTMKREITYVGASIEQAASMLRMPVPEGWYVAVIEADGTWWHTTLTIMPVDEEDLHPF
jgi:hypothetical protein